MRYALIAAILVAGTAAAQTGIADVEFDDQESDGTSVTVQQVTLSNGGFVVIHDHRLDMGDAVGSVIGVSEYLGAGTHDDVVVSIDIGDATNVTLVAMAHFDSNDNQEYDFVTSAGADDGPYSGTDGPVTDDAQITVQQDGTGTVGADRETEEDNDSPAFGIIALVALLGAAAVLVRRRR